MISGSSSPTDPRALLVDGPLLLYDGECGVCASSVQWLLAREEAAKIPVSARRLRFVPLESPLGRDLRAKSGVPASVDSVLWVELDRDTVIVERYTGALLRALSYLGGVHRAGLVLRIVPRFLRDLGYRLFARYRLRIRSPRCLVPTPEERRRFLRGDAPLADG